MHIAEGILSTKILIGGAVLASLGIAAGLRKISPAKMMHVALFSSAFFVASLIHIRVGAAEVHLMLSGLMGVALGVTAIPAIFIALLLQAILFQFGGLSILGVNTFIIATPAVIIAAMFRPMLRSEKQKVKDIGAFLCGAMPILVSAIMVTGTLILTDPTYQVSAFTFLAVNLPLALIEGGITLIIVRFILKIRPEILAVQ